MAKQLPIYLIVVKISLTLANKDEIGLPPCPRHLQYLPQDLPMHCRMPRNADYQTPPPYPFFQSPPPGDVAPPIPIPSFPGMQGIGMPPGMPPMPPGMNAPGGGPPMPGPIPMPMPIPMVGGPSHKLPVIVMPFYSPDRSHNRHPRPPRRKKPHYHHDSHDSSTDSEDDSESESDVGWWKGHKRRHKKYGISRRVNKDQAIRRKKKKTELLTPVLQYVTKDGYVIFEKKITKSEANDWLGPKEEAKVNEAVNFDHDFEVIDTNSHKPKVNSEVEDLNENRDTTKISKEKKDKSSEVNEMDESPKTEKPHIKHRRRKFPKI